MRLCGCNHKEKLGCSNGIPMEYQIRISRSGERQKICQIVAMKITGNILCSGKLGSLCCRWNAYHQNLDRMDEMIHLPGAWLWKTFQYCIIRRSEVTWGLLFMSRYCGRKHWLDYQPLFGKRSPHTSSHFGEDQRPNPGDSGNRAYRKHVGTVCVPKFRSA